MNMNLSDYNGFRTSRKPELKLKLELELGLGLELELKLKLKLKLKLGLELGLEYSSAIMSGPRSSSRLP